MQVCAPVAGLNLPAWQGIQPALLPPVGEYVPTGQHVIDDLTPVYAAVGGRTILIILLVPENAVLVMRTTLLQSKFTECKEKLLWKASLSMNVMLFGIATSWRLVNANALAPRLVTVDGISMAPKFDDLKADAPMVSSTEPVANVTANDAELHNSNALAPRLVTVDGISMAPRPVQDSKADAPMLTIAGLEANATTDSEIAPLNVFAGKSVTPAGTATAVRPDPENASLPMVSSKEPDSKNMPQSALQSLKASAVIAVTGAGTNTLPSLSTLLLQSSAVHVRAFPAAV